MTTWGGDNHVGMETNKKLSLSVNLVLQNGGRFIAKFCLKWGSSSKV